MRLFLSSENLGNYPEVFLEMLGTNKNLAVVHNAIDDWSEEEKKQKIEKHQKQLKSQGFVPQELDLRNYFGDEQKLTKKMREFGGIFIFGGNTFVLNRAMHDSGLIRILRHLITEDKIAYGGSSAGSIVASPSLHGTEWGDDPTQVEKVYKKTLIWEAMNLVQFYIVPHYETDWFGKEAQQMIDFMEEHNLKYKALNDGQVIVIDGDKEEFLK